MTSHRTYNPKGETACHPTYPANCFAPLNAINFALDKLDDALSAQTFMSAWREGDLSEWPEYVAFCSEQQ